MTANSLRPAPAAPPSLAEIEDIARAAFETIPGELRSHVDNIQFHVQDFPDAEISRDMGLQSPFDLLGLYSGISLDRQSVADQPQDIDRIILYRRPILDFWCETNDDLTGIVRHVLIHEIGHHFGFSDEDMERIEAQE